MFKSEAQRSTVCGLILESVGLSHLWDAQGPTEQACEWHTKPRTMPGFSHGELVVWAFAWEVWNETGKFHMGEAMATLDGINLHMIGSLLVALSGCGSDVDHWIAAQNARHEVTRRRRAEREKQAQAKLAQAKLLRSVP